MTRRTAMRLALGLWLPLTLSTAAFGATVSTDMGDELQPARLQHVPTTLRGQILATPSPTPERTPAPTAGPSEGRTTTPADSTSRTDRALARADALVPIVASGAGADAQAQSGARFSTTPPTVAQANRITSGAGANECGFLNLGCAARGIGNWIGEQKTKWDNASAGDRLKVAAVGVGIVALATVAVVTAPAWLPVATAAATAVAPYVSSAAWGTALDIGWTKFATNHWMSREEMAGSFVVNLAFAGLMAGATKVVSAAANSGMVRPLLRPVDRALRGLAGRILPQATRIPLARTIVKNVARTIPSNSLPRQIVWRAAERVPGAASVVVGPAQIVRYAEEEALKEAAKKLGAKDALRRAVSRASAGRLDTRKPAGPLDAIRAAVNRVGSAIRSLRR